MRVRRAAKETPRRWRTPLGWCKLGRGVSTGVFVAMALTAGPAIAQTVDVALNPRTATVGDRIEAVLTLRTEAPLVGEPRFPVWGRAWGSAEVLAKEPARRDEDGAWRQRIVIAAFQTGRVDLPPVAVAVPRRDRTVQARTPAGLSLEIRSVLPPGERNPEPRPAAPLRPLPIGAPFWWTLAAMSTACLLLGWALWRQGRRAEGRAPGKPQPGPYEELVARLDSLAAESSMVLLHTRLSLALRDYFGRSLSFPAAESTTTEIHRRLLAQRVPGALVRRAVELLRACDLVKFARQEVGEGLGRERVAAARQLAREIDGHVRPQEPAEGPRRLEAAG